MMTGPMRQCTVIRNVLSTGSCSFSPPLPLFEFEFRDLVLISHLGWFGCYGCTVLWGGRPRQGCAVRSSTWAWRDLVYIIRHPMFLVSFFWPCAWEKDEMRKGTRSVWGLVEASEVWMKDEAEGGVTCYCNHILRVTDMRVSMFRYGTKTHISFTSLGCSASVLDHCSR